ncbi:unnamed protein product, partial [Prorocentrum cordatum]
RSALLGRALRVGSESELPAARALIDRLDLGRGISEPAPAVRASRRLLAGQFSAGASVAQLGVVLLRQLEERLGGLGELSRLWPCGAWQDVAEASELLPVARPTRSAGLEEAPAAARTCRGQPPPANREVGIDAWVELSTMVCNYGFRGGPRLLARLLKSPAEPTATQSQALERFRLLVAIWADEGDPTNLVTYAVAEQQASELYWGEHLTRALPLTRDGAPPPGCPLRTRLPGVLMNTKEEYYMIIESVCRLGVMEAEVVNLAPTNALQRNCGGAAQTMGYPGLWPLYVLHPDEVQVRYSEDKGGYFHLYTAPRARRGAFFIDEAVLGTALGQPGCSRARPRMRTCPMGWISAAAFIQGARENLVTGGPPHGAGLPREQRIRTGHPVQRAPEKAAEGRLTRETLGAQFCGADRLDGTSPPRWSFCVGRCLDRVAGERVINDDLLSDVGRISFAALFHRGFFSLLSRPPRDLAVGGLPGPLGPDVADELLVATLATPLLQADPAGQVSGEAVATDASETGGGTRVSAGLSPKGAARPLLVNGFDGIGGARATLDLLAATPCGAIAVEPSRAARAVAKATWPETFFHFDSAAVAAEEVAKWAGACPRARRVFHISGPPCQDCAPPKHSLRMSGPLQQRAEWNARGLFAGVATLAFQGGQEVTQRVGEQPIFVE